MLQFYSSMIVALYQIMKSLWSRTSDPYEFAYPLFTTVQSSNGTKKQCWIDLATAGTIRKARAKLSWNRKVGTPVTVRFVILLMVSFQELSTEEWESILVSIRETSTNPLLKKSPFLLMRKGHSKYKDNLKRYDDRYKSDLERVNAISHELNMPIHNLSQGDEKILKKIRNATRLMDGGGRLCGLPLPPLHQTATVLPVAGPIIVDLLILGLILLRIRQLSEYNHFRFIFRWIVS